MERETPGWFRDDFDVGDLVVQGEEIGIANLLKILKKRITREYKGKISAVILSSESPLEEVLETQEDITLGFFKESEFTAFLLKRTTRDKEDKEKMISGRFYAAELSEGIWVCFTTDSQDFIEKGLLRILGDSSPNVSRMFFSSDEIRASVERVMLSNDLRGIAKKAVSYPYGGGAEINYDERDLDEVFDRCRVDRTYLDKARIVLLRGREQICDFFLSREGIFRFHEGDVDFFSRRLLMEFAGVALATKTVLEKRERKIGELSSRPLEIEFEEAVLTRPEDNVKLVNCVSELEKSAVSVYHLNPYLHMSFVDFSDGSSYDVFAVSPKSICIVPSYKSSIDSLMRLSSKLNETLGEGKIKEWTEKKWEMRDFFE